MPNSAFYRLLLATACGLALTPMAEAQQSPAGAYTVPTCNSNNGNQLYPVAQIKATTQDVFGNSCVESNATVSALASLTNVVTTIKATGGEFYGYMANNPAATTCFVQVYNLTSAAVTTGTTAPTFSIPLPTGVSNFSFAGGIPLASGITIAATATFSGSGACASGVVFEPLYA